MTTEFAVPGLLARTIFTPAAKLGWSAGRYAEFAATLRAAYPGVVYEGEAGFFPPPAPASVSAC